MNNFYVTLPSNTISDSHENTASNFVVRLPQRLHLEGDWECGLCEILYPHDWKTLPEKDCQFSILVKDSRIADDFSVDVITLDTYFPSAYYPTIKNLIDVINHSFKKQTQSMQQYPSIAMLQNGINFSYNPLLNRASIQLNASMDSVSITMSPTLQNMLGFKERAVFNENLMAEYPPDMRAGFESMYVYCNIVEPQIVGDTLAPLIRIINIEGEYPNIIDRVYDNPHYIPIQIKDISEIEINVKTDTGDYVPFLSGKVVMKLHFRRVRVKMF